MTEETKKKIGNALRKQTYFFCDYCGIQASAKPSHYQRSKKHFCCMKCYADYRMNIMHFTEQPSYKGVRKAGESKQIYHKNYCDTHPDNIAHLKARRYAREKGAEGSHSLNEWNNLKTQYGYKCAICGESKPLTKDHIVPLSKGGSDYIDNIQPLCRNCNSKKWANDSIHETPELLTT